MSYVNLWNKIIFLTSYQNEPDTKKHIRMDMSFLQTSGPPTVLIFAKWYTKDVYDSSAKVSHCNERSSFISFYHSFLVASFYYRIMLMIFEIINMTYVYVLNYLYEYVSRATVTNYNLWLLSCILNVHISCNFNVYRMCIL